MKKVATLQSSKNADVSATKVQKISARAIARALRAKDFLSVLDLSHEELDDTLALAAQLKADRKAGRKTAAPLLGKHVALLFDKPSLRTKSTFTIAVRELGGDVIDPAAEVALGSRETVTDVAKNLERWVAGAIVRTFAPIVAGVSNMRYRTFVTYNIVGGALWGAGLTTLGHYLGDISWVKDNIEIASLVIVAI